MPAKRSLGRPQVALARPPLRADGYCQLFGFPITLKDLENLATAYPGVEKAYAIQAGREVRVIVDAKMIDDKSSAKVARDIAKKIENEMQYPGEIKVTVLREVRSVEYAR